MGPGLSIVIIKPNMPGPYTGPGPGRPEPLG